MDFSLRHVYNNILLVRTILVNCVWKILKQIKTAVICFCRIGLPHMNIVHLNLNFAAGSGIGEVIRNLLKYEHFYGHVAELICDVADNSMIESVKPAQVFSDLKRKRTPIPYSYGLLPPTFGRIAARASISFFRSWSFVEKRIKAANVVHAHFYPYNAHALLSKPEGKRLVVHNYGIPNNLSGWGFKDRLWLTAARRSEHLFSEADVVISISDFLRNELLKRTGIDSIVIPAGVDPNEYYFSSVYRRSIRERYKISDGTYVILYVGRLAPYKRVDQVIQAFKLVRDEIESVLLITADQSKNEFSLRRLVGRLGLEESILFVEPQTEIMPWLPPYYSACDACASCSEWEGFGLPFIEAAACEKPSVGFDCIPSILDLAKLGLGIAVNQHTVEAFADALLNARNLRWEADAKRQFLERYSWQNLCERIMKAYTACGS